MPAFVKRYWKVGLAVVAAGLWIVGLSDQIGSLDMVARYIGISVAMAALAVLA